MNRQQEHSCIAYFKSNPVWDRVFRGFWEKYRSYGSFSGKVVLQKITAEEVEGLEGFFAKSYHGKKSVTVSAERFSQALLSSRFSNMTPEHGKLKYEGEINDTDDLETIFMNVTKEEECFYV